MHAPHIQVLLTQAKLHVFYSVGLKNVTYYSVYYYYYDDDDVYCLSVNFWPSYLQGARRTPSPSNVFYVFRQQGYLHVLLFSESPFLLIFIQLWSVPPFLFFFFFFPPPPLDNQTQYVNYKLRFLRSLRVLPLLSFLFCNFTFLITELFVSGVWCVVSAS
jgi:hypothetical protein